MQTHILPTEDLTGIYRFALLLTGSPRDAQALVLEVFSDAAEKIHHFRNGKSCEAWLVAKVRTRVLNKPFQPAAGPASENADDILQPGPELELASRFSTLPEPGRSALALLYINLFSIQEIAQILQLPMEALGDALDTARASLRGLETSRQASGQAAGQAAASAEGIAS